MSRYTDALVARRRAESLLLRQDSANKIASVFNVFHPEHLDSTFSNLADITSKVVRRQRVTSSGLASNWTRDYRAAHGLSGEPPIDWSVTEFDEAHWTKNLHAQTVASVKNNVAKGLSIDGAMTRALTNVQGMAIKWTLDSGRDLILDSVARDKHSQGWRRVISGSKGCSFCTMLANRPQNYSKETAHFASHDHCSCSCVPVYGGKAIEVDKKFEQTKRKITDNQREQIREYLKTHPTG